MDIAVPQGRGWQKNKSDRRCYPRSHGPFDLDGFPRGTPVSLSGDAARQIGEIAARDEATSRAEAVKGVTRRTRSSRRWRRASCESHKYGRAALGVAAVAMEQQATERQPTIMIVEGDEHTRRAYSAHLRHSGFVVVEAGTGPEAVERASERSFDLILMDMNLPDLDGWEAARRIKSDPDSSRAPLVAFSAPADSSAHLP